MSCVSFLAVLGLPCCLGSSLVAESGGCSPALIHRLLIAVASRCGAQAQQLWYTGWVAPGHVGSFLTRDQTHVPCIGRRILYHRAAREAPC